MVEWFVHCARSFNVDNRAQPERRIVDASTMRTKSLIFRTAAGVPNYFLGPCSHSSDNVIKIGTIVSFCWVKKSYFFVFEVWKAMNK